MRRRWMILLVIAVIAMVFVTGCKDDTTDPELNEFEILSQYMLTSGMDLPAMLADAYILYTQNTKSICELGSVSTRCWAKKVAAGRTRELPSESCPLDSDQHHPSCPLILSSTYMSTLSILRWILLSGPRSL